MTFATVADHAQPTAAPPCLVNPRAARDRELRLYRARRSASREIVVPSSPGRPSGAWSLERGDWPSPSGKLRR